MTIPPLLLLAEGRKPRLRKAPTVRERELKIHMPIAKLLMDHCRPEWRWSHFPSGEARDARAGAKLKAMGLQRGWPDFILVSPEGIFHGLELKAPKGVLSESQEGFQTWANRWNVVYVVAWSIEECLAAFQEWQCLDPRIKF
jgi:hypothetical protein